MLIFVVNIRPARTFWNSTRCLLSPFTLDWSRNLWHNPMWNMAVNNISYPMYPIQRELRKVSSPKWYLSFFVQYIRKHQLFCFIRKWIFNIRKSFSNLWKRISNKLWNGISQKDLQRLNVFQHLVYKNAQGLPKRTRSDIWRSTDTFRDRCPELLFFGRLCRLDCRTLPKWYFIPILLVC